MERRTVISRKNLPTRIPLWPTVITWLLLDYYDASGVVHGIVWTIWVIIWIAAIVSFYIEDYKDVV